MDNKQTEINRIIIRYLDGSASVDEKRILLYWLKESGQNWHEFNQIRDIWLSCEAAMPEESETDIAFGRLKNRILNNVAQPTGLRRAIRFWIQIAAVFLLLSGMGYWFTHKPDTIIEKEIVVHNQLITAPGSKGKFLLPDGTVVWLNADSKLIYPETFEENKRKVKLSGEGYFEVAHNAKKPFVVQADDLELEVLGTSFDISCYSYKQTTDIVLIDGEVKVNAEKMDKSITLTPDLILGYNKQSGNTTINNAKTSLYIDWIKDRLVFDNAPLSEIIISLEGWHNVTIHCPAAYARKTHMSFTVRKESIEEILRAMSLIIPIKYTINDHEINIIP